MNIRNHFRAAIHSGLSAKLTQRNGYSGGLFVGADEPTGGTFIPFESMGYNSKFGYFDIRQFPDQPTDCTNENEETIHEAIYSDGWKPIVWFDGDGSPTMIGDVHQVADLYQALGRYLIHGELSEPVDEEEVEGNGFRWATAKDAAYIAHRQNEDRFPDPANPQLANTIIAAGKRGAIKTRLGKSGTIYYQAESVRDWADQEPKSGRPRKGLSDLIENFDGDVNKLQHKLADSVRSSTGKIPHGQLWQPCEVQGCDNEPVCMNCMKCQDKHCHCFD